MNVPRLGAYWKFQTNMLVVKANESGAGILAAILKKAYWKQAPLCRDLSISCPQGASFSAQGRGKSLVTYRLKTVAKNKKIFFTLTRTIMPKTQILQPSASIFHFSAFIIHLSA